MDPDSSGVIVTVTDGRGRRVADGGLARWLSRVAPARVRGEIAVALITDGHIRKLNRQYRGKDAVTDVLSFPAEDFRLKPEATRSGGIGSGGIGSGGVGSSGVASGFSRKAPEPRSLGDIVIATGLARRQAREAGHAYATELRVLALHGLLHLLGYDHDDRDDRGRMARAEARLRRAGGLQAGLIARTAAAPPAREKAPAAAARVKKRLRPARAASAEGDRAGVGPRAR